MIDPSKGNNRFCNYCYLLGKRSDILNCDNYLLPVFYYCILK